jgi:hypothetical protein
MYSVSYLLLIYVWKEKGGFINSIIVGILWYNQKHSNFCLTQIKEFFKHVLKHEWL